MRHLKRTSTFFQQLFPLFLLPAFVVSCQPKGQNHRHRGIPEEAVPGSFKIILESCVPEAERLSLLQSRSEEIATRIGCQVASVQALAFQEPVADLAASYHVQFEGCSMGDDRLKEALDLWEEVKGIKEVEAEAVVRSSEETQDQADPLQEKQYYLKTIHREEACKHLSMDKLQPVIVAVIDTGVDQDHPDLVASFLRDSQGKVIGANFVGKGSKAAPDDQWDDKRGHGTHVAGLIAATAQNAKGVAGVASCAPIRIMPVRVLGNNGKGTTLEIERGVEWALSKGADVINLSLGGTRFFKDAKDEHRSSLYEMARAKKVIVFASAGNSSYRLGKYYEVTDKETKKTSKGYVYSYPGSYDNVITVAATNAKNQLTSFSNHGYGVDIAAPGSLTLSTYPNGQYKNMSGTSMASPIAAGSYALVLSGTRATRNERFGYADVYPLLTQATGAGKFMKNDVLSQGVLDVNKLLMATQAKFAPQPRDEMPEPGTPEEPKTPLEPAPSVPPMETCSYEPGK